MLRKRWVKSLRGVQIRARSARGRRLARRVGVLALARCREFGIPRLSGYAVSDIASLYRTGRRWSPPRRLWWILPPPTPRWCRVPSRGKPSRRCCRVMTTGGPWRLGRALQYGSPPVSKLLPQQRRRERKESRRQVCHRRREVRPGGEKKQEERRGKARDWILTGDGGSCALSGGDALLAA